VANCLSMRHFLPSLGALRAFEVAARHASFTRAADELSITQTAVSHQIKTLEEQLGVKLFIRHRNTLQLTDAAQRYLPAVRSAIETLSDATDSLVKMEQDSILTVSTLATFAVKCLIPRLGSFTKLYPEIMLRIAASVSFGEFNRKTHDLAIRWGDGDWPGMRVDKIFSEEIFPVCSPALLEGPVPLREPADLARHPIIRNGFSFLFRDDWPAWLGAAGVGGLELSAALTFEFALPAMEAAAQGLGVALGRSPFVDEDLRSGRLVRPFDLSVRTRAAYYLVCPRETANRAKIKAFRNWLLDAVATEGGPSEAKRDLVLGTV
jgi:LysR family glycine cleavage system transcriptional activator